MRKTHEPIRSARHRHHRANTTLVPLALLALIAGGCRCGVDPIDRAQSSLITDPSTIDFGTVEAGTTASALLRLSNQGTASLTIEALAIVDDPAGRFAVEGAPETIAAGASAEVTVRYAAPLEDGADAAAISIVSDADNARELRIALVARSKQSCHPATCATLGFDCGTADDGCGGTLSCGACGDDQTCTDNLCTCAPEADAAFCARLGKNCGEVTANDNCGAARTVSCGACAGDQACTENVCTCAPEADAAFCARLGKDCGAVTADDNCGAARTASCGTCAGNQTCDANVCTCTAESDAAFCARLGKNCGEVTANDDCGAMRTATCGSCTSPQTCGGLGVANVCATPPPTGLCQRDFCWENPIPDGNDHLAVWPVAPNDVWITSEQFLLHYDGAAFSSVDLGLSNGRGVQALYGFSPTDVWAAGCYDAMFHFDGTSWSTSPLPSTGSCLTSLFGATPSDVWAVGQYAETLHNTGSGWTTATKALSSSYTLQGLGGSSTSDVWAVGANASTVRFNGGSWQVVSNPITSTSPGWASTLWSVFSLSSGEAWAVGYNGSAPVVLHYGGGWQTVTTAATSSQYAVWASASNSVWTAGADGFIQHYDGASWSAEPTGSTAALFALRGTGASDVWAVGKYGEVLQRTNGAWKSLSAAATRSDLSAMWGSSATDLYAVGAAGAIAHYNGTTWIDESWPGLYSLRGVWGSSANDVWAAGFDTAGGVLLHRTGTGWSKVTLPTGTPRFFGLWGSSASDVWAVSEQQRIYHYDGTGWTETIHAGSGGGYDFAAVHGTSGSNVWAISQNAIFHYDGSAWTAVRSGIANEEYHAVWVASPSAVFVGGHDPSGAMLLVWDGTQFNQSAIASGQTPRGLWGTSAQDYWIVGDHGMVEHVVNGTPTAIANPSHNFIGWLGVWGSGAGDVRIFGYGGSILRYAP